MIELEIRLFGAFRRYEIRDVPLRVSVDKPATVEKIKWALAEKLRLHSAGFSDSQLVEDSALATDLRVLSPGERVNSSCVLSVLPPVCGG